MTAASPVYNSYQQILGTSVSAEGTARLWNPKQRPVLLNRHTNGTESVNPRYFPKKAKFVSKQPMFIKMAPFGLMATISISMGLC